MYRTLNNAILAYNEMKYDKNIRDTSIVSLTVIYNILVTISNSRI